MNIQEQYLTAAKTGKALLIEKRSKFMSLTVSVSGEEAAKAEIARVRENHREASHNCWCYIIRNGIERYSDDGEPQGTAGLPMLEVFKREGLSDVCCVVTRYYGGTMLGKGGLKRAYSEAAKLALDDAGIAEYKRHHCMDITCSYNLSGKIKHELETFGVILNDIQYTENVTFKIALLTARSANLNKRLADITSGEIQGIITGTKYIAVSD